MTIAQSLLPELENELGITRRVLERVPENRFDWKPHVKSYTLHDLAGHLANVYSWGRVTLSTTELDVSQPFERPRYETTGQILETFEKHAKDFRETLARMSDADMLVHWALKAGPHVFFSLPRVAVLRGFVMNHSIHHRGQLTVYLRLLDIALPSVYGPSADDNPMGMGK